jgi:hypothetical protein
MVLTPKTLLITILSGCVNNAIKKSQVTVSNLFVIGNNGTPDERTRKSNTHDKKN